MRQPRRRRRRQRGDEPALGEPADVPAEHPGREAVRGDDDARVLWRRRELRLRDRRQRQVAERTVAVPALVAGLGVDALRLRVRPEVGQRLEPVDPGEAVPELPARLGIEEVGGERGGVGVGEAERRDPFFRRRTPPSRPDGRAGAEHERDPEQRGRVDRVPTPGRERGLVEAEDRPAAVERELSQPLVGVDDDRVADRFEERQVGVAVRVRGRGGEVVAVLGGERPERGCLPLAVRRPQRAAGVDAVHDLARRADRPVEAELARELLDDLLQRRRDDVCRLAAVAVLVGERERLPVDERLQHRLHCAGDEAAQVVDREAFQDHQAVLGRLPHRLRARPTRREEELPGRGLRQLPAADDAVLAECAGERERAGAPQQRPVEVEEGGSLHEASVRMQSPHEILTDPLPAPALETSEFERLDL